MMKIIVIILCCLPFVLGFVTMVWLGIAYFTPEKEKKIEITIEIDPKEEDYSFKRLPISVLFPQIFFVVPQLIILGLYSFYVLTPYPMAKEAAAWE